MTFAQPLAVFADLMTPSNAFAVNPDYLIGSASNADQYGIATMELTDEDYYIQPFSSVGTVSNTINETAVIVQYTNGQFTNGELIRPVLNNGRYEFSWSMPDIMDGYWVSNVFFILQSKADRVSGLPSPPGNYNFSMDFSSDFSYGLSDGPYWSSCYSYENSIYDVKSHGFSGVSFSSGDMYIPPVAFNIRSGYWYNRIHIVVKQSDLLQNFGGSYAVNFTPTDNVGIELAGANVSSSEMYEDSVSGSLSDISSFIGDMSSSMDSAAESLEYISTSQNLIIQGIDNVIMHISDQLYAFWDQLYNLIHEPTYARLVDILDAIQNLDLEITVEMKEVTDAVNKMNQDMQNKLQNVQQTITQGFDNSVMESEASKLDDSISEYDEAEQSVIQNVNDSLNDFEFDAELGEYQSIVSVVSDFLQQLYESSGGFKVLINLSMLLSLAGIVIGIYRFGGGS